MPEVRWNGKGVNRGGRATWKGHLAGFLFYVMILSVSIRTEQLRYRKETLLSDDLAHFKTLRDLRLD